MKPKSWKCSTARREDWDAERWSITLFQGTSIANAFVLDAPSLTWSALVSGGVLPADARAFANSIRNASRQWEKWNHDTGKPAGEILK